MDKQLDFVVGTCGCGREGVLLGDACRRCLLARIGEHVGTETHAAVIRAFSTATARLLPS